MALYYKEWGRYDVTENRSGEDRVRLWKSLFLFHGEDSILNQTEAFEWLWVGLT